MGGGRRVVALQQKQISGFYPNHDSDEGQVLALNALPSYPNPWVRLHAHYTGITDNLSTLVRLRAVVQTVDRPIRPAGLAGSRQSTPPNSHP